jgi:hypothetical protein
MLRIILICLTALFALSAKAQEYTYTIKADSVLLTGNTCDSTELILLNHTQDTTGFLFNPGPGNPGRTFFRHGLIQVSQGVYLIGADTLNIINALGVNPGTNFVKVAGNYTALTNYAKTVIDLNAVSGIITLPDPTSVAAQGKVYMVRVDAFGQTATVVSAVNQIEISLGSYATSVTITGIPFQGWVSDGSNWRLIN